MPVSCPRCQGAMIPDPDGAYCLCCGYVSYPEPPLPWVRTMTRKEERRKPGRSVVGLG